MGLGYGAIRHMIDSLKYNNSLKRKKSYFKLKSDYLNLSRKQGLVYQTATPEQLQALRKRLIEDRNKERIKSFIILLIAIAVVTILIVGLTDYIVYYFETTSARKREFFQ